jgi:hypothetical protein
MPKLVAGCSLGVHNFNCKSSSLFTRILNFLRLKNLYVKILLIGRFVVLEQLARRLTPQKINFSLGA